MSDIRHYPSGLSPAFSEAIRIDGPGGSWILVSGQLGVPMTREGRPDDMDFAEEVGTCFDRIAATLQTCGATLSDMVRVDVHLTDLSLYPTFGKLRAAFFPQNPPTSTAVQVAGLLLNARIEIGGMAWLPAD